MRAPSRERRPPAGVGIRRVLLGLAASAAAGAPGLAGCASFESNVYNLRELHTEDGKVRYRAALMGDTEYFFRTALRVEAPLGFELRFDDKQPERIKNPTRLCLAALLELSRHGGTDERLLAVQTEIYAWLAASDPYVLARERCLIELGPIAHRLGVAEPLELGPDAEVPDVERLTASITELIAAARAVLADPDDPAAREALAARCAETAALEHDGRSARRVLRTAAALLGAPGAGRRAFDPVRGLVLAVGRRHAALALTATLSDPVPRVRAAALDAWVAATDNGCGALLAEALSDESPDVVHRVLRSVAEHGLPPAPPAGEDGTDPPDPEAWRESWLASLVRLAVESPEGHLAAAACQALARVSGSGIESLRFDEWVAWWRARTAGEDAGSSS